MKHEQINGYAVTIVDETFAVAHHGAQVVKTGTPDKVRAYCSEER